MIRCCFCRFPTSVTDRLRVGGQHVAHFTCALTRAMELHKTRAVMVAAGRVRQVRS